MKRRIFLTVLSLLLMATQAHAFNYGANYYRQHRTQALSGNPYTDPIYLALQEIEANIGFNAGTGTAFYVDSGVAYEGVGDSWTNAKDTLDEAINLCTASAGDVIYVAPGHTETKSATGALWTADVIGVTIIGLGSGSLRPKFTLSHTGAKIDITANNVHVHNIYVDATGVDSVNTPVNISGEGVVVSNCFFRLADTGGQADLGITIGVADGDANDVTIAGCEMIAPDAGAASAITFAKDMENVTVRDCRIYGDFSTAAIDIAEGGNAQENILFERVTAISKNADEFALYANGTGNTGSIVSCFFAADAAATILDAGGLSVSSDTQLIVIGNGEPTPMPANKTIYDLLGAYTADGGADDEDTIMAHLDLILADTAAADTSSELVALVDPNYITYDAPRVLADTTSAMTAGNGYTAAGDPVIFTVTGDILCKAFCHISTQITSTSSDTLELGVTGNTACLLVQDIADGTAFDAGDDWSLITAADAPGAQLADEWCFIGGGADIKLFINDHDLTAGVATFYLHWIPCSADAAVVGAAP